MLIIFGLHALSEISCARSPPLRQIRPAYGEGLDWSFFFNNGFDQCHKSFKGATARETTVLNFLFLISSALVCCVVIFFKPIASATAFTTLSFLPILSTR